METVKIIQVNPEEFKDSILTDIKKELTALVKALKPKSPDEYLTRQEVSALLKINISTVDNWTRNGKIQPIYIGNRVYFRRKTLEESLIQI